MFVTLERASLLVVVVGIHGWAGSMIKCRFCDCYNRKTTEELMASLGDDFFHIKRTPEMMARLQLRLDRGILMADTFSITHFTPDSTVSGGTIERSGTHSIQTQALPLLLTCS